MTLDKYNKHKESLMSIICEICKLQFKNNHSLAAHIRIKHELTKKQYYDLYIKQDGEGSCLECGKDTSFRGNCYLTFCSKKCYSSNIGTREALSKRVKGKKQSEETIKKRIQNTDQKQKEQARVASMMEKHGTLSTTAVMTEEAKKERSKKISNFHSGKKHTKEHHEKVIESKRKNGTLNHTNATKQRMSDSHIANYQSDDPPMPMSINSKGPNGRGHETGHINGIFYRSSYEKTFLEYCYNKNIKIEPASTKEFRVAYKDEVESKLRMYYPDFYLPDYDIIIEIKPLSMLDFENNEIKIDTGMREHSLVLVTEEELEDLDAFFEYLS